MRGKKAFIFVFLLFCVLIGAKAADTGQEPWRVLWVIQPQIQAQLKDGTKVDCEMSEEDIKHVKEVIPGFIEYIATASDNKIGVLVDMLLSQEPVKTLSLYKPGSYMVDFCDLPLGVQLAAEGYDSVLVTVRLTLEERDIASDWWGLGTMHVADRHMGYGVIQMLPGEDYWYFEKSEDIPYPEEVWVHEFLHGLEFFYSSMGYPMPELDNGGAYGYQRTSQVVHGWRKFYEDFLCGRVYDENTRHTAGVKPEMWRMRPHKTPAFWDISEIPQKKEINFAASQGWFAASPEHVFLPNSWVTQAMAATVLYNFSGDQAYSDAIPGGAEEAWYTRGVLWAQEKGLFSGIEPARVQPSAVITRQQLSVMLYRYLKSQDAALDAAGELSFQDAEEISPWAAEAVCAMQAAGIMETDGKLFRPKGAVTRAELAAILCRTDDFINK